MNSLCSSKNYWSKPNMLESHFRLGIPFCCIVKFFCLSCGWPKHIFYLMLSRFYLSVVTILPVCCHDSTCLLSRFYLSVVTILPDMFWIARVVQRVAVYLSENTQHCLCCSAYLSFGFFEPFFYDP